MKGITGHIVAHTHETFLFYAVKSIYKYMDSILLYWNGERNAIFDKTLKDIKKLDKKRKVIIREVQLETKEWKWSTTNISRLIRKNAGKRSVGSVRKMQIDDTETEFFFLCDADEVHYAKSMKTIISDILPTWDDSHICGFIPLVWYADIDHTFPHYTPVGRIFKTDRVYLNSNSPNEMHIDVMSGKIIQLKDSISINLSDQLIPYAHFEHLLKPWRRKVATSAFQETKSALPGVMKTNQYYINKFLTLGADDTIEDYEPEPEPEVEPEVEVEVEVEVIIEPEVAEPDRLYTVRLLALSLMWRDNNYAKGAIFDVTETDLISLSKLVNLEVQ